MCKFCSEFKEWKELIKKSSENEEPKLNRFYEARLVMRSVINERTTTGITIGSYELNYCPVCGEKVEKDV